MVLGETAGAEASPDVIVGGSGPAGLVAAIACSAMGLSAVVVAPLKARRPESLRPLETLHPRALELLQGIGAEGAASASAVAAFSDIVRNGRLEAFDQAGGPAVHIDRDLFDRALAAVAVGKGVQRRTGSIVAVDRISSAWRVTLCDGEVRRAPWLIDATGRPRAVSRLLGLGTRRLGPALITRTGTLDSGGTEGIGRTRFDSFDWGWIWQTPELRGVHTWTALHSAHRKPPAEVERLTEAALPGSSRVERATWIHSHPAGSEGFLAVGDSAGTIDPASGQGLLNACACGLAAARTVARSLAAAELTSLLVAEYHRWFVHRLTRQARQLEDYYRRIGVGLAGRA